MHFYNFSINDFNASTRHLSHLERALFRDLIDMYYQQEKPIINDMAYLARKLLVRTDDEKQALQQVLEEFFVLKKLKGDSAPCWHLSRIDRELKNYKYRQTPSNETQTPSNAISNSVKQTSNAHQTKDDRQQTHKDKVNFLVKSLKDKGIKANARMKIADLQTLFDEHCKQTSNAHQTPSNENQTPSNGHQTAFGESITNNQEPLTINQEPKKEAVEIFNFWCTTMGKDKSTKLSPKRESKILARLKDGYTIDKIKTAIVACSKSDWHMANSHNDIELICRDVEHLDKFLDMSNKSQQPRFGGKNDPLAVNQHWQNNGNQVVGGFVIPQAGVQKW